MDDGSEGGAGGRVKLDPMAPTVHGREDPGQPS